MWKKKGNNAPKRPVGVPEIYNTYAPSEQNPWSPYLSSPLVPFLPLSRSKTDHLQTRPPLSLTKHHNPFPPKTRPPHRITRFRQLPHKPARLHIPQLHPPVVPAGDDEPLIKL